MLDRGALVVQMAKAFSGEFVGTGGDRPNEQDRRRAEDALARVEIYLGIDIEEAKDVLDRVLEDVT